MGKQPSALQLTIPLPPSKAPIYLTRRSAEIYWLDWPEAIHWRDPVDGCHSPDRRSFALPEVSSRQL